MNDNELRDRIAGAAESGELQWQHEMKEHVHDVRAHAHPGPRSLFVAQAIIDELGLTTRGTCGYVEIYGNYDTKFEENDQ